MTESVFIFCNEPDNGANYGQSAKHRKENLPAAVRPFALYFAGASVNHKAIYFAFETVSTDPDWQQNMLESYIIIGCV